MKNKLIIVLDRLRSAHNVGNIFRIAEALGADEIIACGYTPAPPHPRLEKTAMGSDKMVPCRCFASSLEAVKVLRQEGVKEILAAEPLPGSVPAWKREYNFPLAVIFGNEALGDNNADNHTNGGKQAVFFSKLVFHFKIRPLFLLLKASKITHCSTKLNYCKYFFKKQYKK